MSDQAPDLSHSPTDLVSETVVREQGREPCQAVGPAFGTHALRLGEFARARWLFALGHTELAYAQLRRAGGRFSEETLRRDLSRLALENAYAALVQGAPRRVVALHLEQASALCACASAYVARSLRDRIGPDADLSREPTSARQWAELLGEDIVFPRGDYKSAEDDLPDLPWPEEIQPRSPAWELIALGWAAMPEVVRVADERRVRRRGGPGRVDSEGMIEHRWPSAGEAALHVAESIAVRPFANAYELRAWWRDAEAGGEFEALAENLVQPAPWVGRSVQRMAELRPRETVRKLPELIASASEMDRADAIRSLVDTLLRPDGAMPSALAIELDRALRVWMRGPPTEVAEAAAQGRKRLSARRRTRNTSLVPDRR